MTRISIRWGLLTASKMRCGLCLLSWGRLTSWGKRRFDMRSTFYSTCSLHTKLNTTERLPSSCSETWTRHATCNYHKILHVKSWWVALTPDTTSFPNSRDGETVSTPTELPRSPRTWKSPENIKDRPLTNSGTFVYLSYRRFLVIIKKWLACDTFPLISSKRPA